MIIIAHRGNLYGPDSRENSPEAINVAIKKGFHVEVDIACKDKEILLGHDIPQYQLPDYFWNDSDYNGKIIYHCKDYAAMEWALSKGPAIHCFAHSDDSFVLTSKRYVWTCDLRLASRNSIIMSCNPILFDMLPYGICTDHPCRMKDYLDYKY